MNFINLQKQCSILYQNILNGGSNLFNSSCVHGFIVACILLYAFFTTRLPKYLIALLATVIITSVWNHGVSNDLAKWCDRTAVTITIIALSLYIYQTKQVSNIYILFLLFIVVGLYFTAKILHLFSFQTPIFMNDII
jgi:hypothetical protein